MDSSKTAEVLKYVILHANFILDFIFEDIDISLFLTPFPLP